MPCRTDPPSADESRRNRLLSNHKKEVTKLKGEVEALKGLLCGASRVLERYNYDFDENPELSEWWQKHKKKDAKRIQKERKEAEQAKRKEWLHESAMGLMERPLNDLNEDERKVLKEAGIL